MFEIVKRPEQYPHLCPLFKFEIQMTEDNIDVKVVMKIPNEILIYIILLCNDYKDYSSIFQTCTYFRDIAFGNDAAIFWRALYESEYGRPLIYSEMLGTFNWRKEFLSKKFNMSIITPKDLTFARTASFKIHCKGIPPYEYIRSSCVVTDKIIKRKWGKTPVVITTPYMISYHLRYIYKEQQYIMNECCENCTKNDKRSVYPLISRSFGSNVDSYGDVEFPVEINFRKCDGKRDKRGIILLDVEITNSITNAIVASVIGHELKFKKFPKNNNNKRKAEFINE